ncbi:MAG: glycosyltransferase [Candidatus Aminicenantes bacterium]|nr:glycosyltransferase [Candidatus Aminicenantes bacterium]NIM83797.1 glycosyltransferase [Candidatus Aminicenantes bacterium]NIN21844.1 glycosyltransferase [Candidatus Aminicenantes bacterium]NIN46951.1 glycosyltransferase [Candidatus Aminicenantes bacterium]NIN89873.1 glycosyltransferase [Candidatus Aminicenantes bacterium]
MKVIDLSIVMAFRNEGSEPEMTVKSILETCDNSGIEILAINDCSDEEADFSRYPQVRYICNKKRLGVTGCRDSGVDEARSENVLIIDGHMRFRKDNWLERGIEAIEKNPGSIFCTTSVDIGSGNFDLKQAVLPINHGLPYYVGCGLKLFLTQKDNPSRPGNYRNIIESKWAEERDGRIYQIPCLMGSNYFFKKAWYQKLHGFKGLKTWGNSEPFLSLKSWLAGGDVKIIKDIEIGHLYRNKNPNAVPSEHIIYNKAVTAKILFTPEFAEELIHFLDDNPKVDKAKELLKANAEEIEAERSYFKTIAKLSQTDCFKKLRIDYII